MIIRDERNLEELITYYILHGVDHFYIYDNESKIPIKTRLYQYIFRQKCTIINFPGRPMQVRSYDHCLKNFGKNTEWLYFIDGDEYVFPKKNSTLREYLMTYNNNPNVHAIGINWVYYGTSFHEKKQDGFIIDKYRYTSNEQDRHIKTVCKPQFTKHCRHAHYVQLYDISKYVDPLGNIISGYANTNPGTIDIIQVTHYFTRSMEESYEKEKRGRTDNTDPYIVPHLHELHNDFKDDSIANKYLKEVSDLYEKINMDWIVYKALNPDLEKHFKKPDEYYNHYYTHGIKENRFSKITDKYPDFSVTFYRQNYKDLEHMTDKELERHYLIHGVNEKRICNSNISKNI